MWTVRLCVERRSIVCASLACAGFLRSQGECFHLTAEIHCGALSASVRCSSEVVSDTGWWSFLRLEVSTCLYCLIHGEWPIPPRSQEQHQSQSLLSLFDSIYFSDANQTQRHIDISSPRLLAYCAIKSSSVLSTLWYSSTALLLAKQRDHISLLVCVMLLNFTMTE